MRLLIRILFLSFVYFHTLGANSEYSGKIERMRRQEVRIFLDVN